MGAQNNIFDPVPAERLALLSHDELLEFSRLQQKVNEQLFLDNKRLRSLSHELGQKALFVEDRYIVLKNKFFGKSSEKEGSEKKEDPSPRPKKRKIQLLSERYSELPRIERDVEFQDLPDCRCCGVKLKDSGMTEDSEFITIIPKQYIVVIQKRHKYRCEKCHGDIQTAPNPPRIKAGSSYSDEMMMDVAMSKYCDLIPIGRYARIAERSGATDLPPQSLIETTHHVAEFVRPAYELLKEEVLSERVLHADETPHRMLEGDDTSHWYLWGFSSAKSSFFEAHDTRSGDVASGYLKNSKCEFLVSDVFSGYGRAVREANEVRIELGLPKIYNAYCNAHARRKFKEAKERFSEEAQFFIDSYKEIYHLESTIIDKPPDVALEIRHQMTRYFDQMKTRAIELIPAFSTKSSLGKAMGYFLGNFKELTVFIKNEAVPIDNNPQERLLRNPVIGRKTWYGTHSRRGAETMAILFSLIESCKLNRVNPRQYLKQLVTDLHEGKKPYTPRTLSVH